MRWQRHSLVVKPQHRQVQVLLTDCLCLCTHTHTHTREHTQIHTHTHTHTRALLEPHQNRNTLRVRAVAAECSWRRERAHSRASLLAFSLFIESERGRNHPQDRGFRERERRKEDEVGDWGQGSRGQGSGVGG
jgi:hypothetical protein